MQATNLKTNHLTQPLGIDAGTLFLSWQCAEGVRQTAYEIEVTAGAETLWTSGKILSGMMHTETPDRKSTRLNSSHTRPSRMPSSA